MLYRYLLLFLLVVALMFFNCRTKDDCPPDEEPVMRTTVRTYFTLDLVRFKRIYALGGKGDISTAGDELLLPLSLRADSVTYIFERQTGKLDTLILCYSRKFGPYANAPKRCGYGADFNGGGDINGPVNNQSVMQNPRYYGDSRTTFREGTAYFREYNRSVFSGYTENKYTLELFTSD